MTKRDPIRTIPILFLVILFVAGLFLTASLLAAPQAKNTVSQLPLLTHGQEFFGLNSIQLHSLTGLASWQGSSGSCEVINDSRASTNDGQPSPYRCRSSD